MLKRMFILIFALVSTLYTAGGPTASAATQSPELLANPGFENGTSGWSAQLATLTTVTSDVYSGASALKIANRSQDWSTALQNVSGALISYGPGNYQISAYVKLAEPLASGSCSPLLIVKYNDGSDHYAKTSRVAINEDSYVKLEGSVDIAWSGDLKSAQMYVQSGLGGTECLADLYVDDFSLVNTDRSIPINQSPELLANPDFESDMASWSAQYATLTVDTSDVHSGASALKIASRSQDWSTAVQNVSAALNSYGPGNYKLSGHVKLAAPLASGSCRPMLVIKYNDGTDHYASTSRVDINENSYTKLEGSVNLSWSGILSSAQLYVQTGTGGTECLADLYVDDFSLVNTDHADPLPPYLGDSSVNLAQNKPVTASDTADGTYSPSYVTDGDTDTINGQEWASDVTQDSQWITIDLQNNIKFNRMELYMRQGFELSDYEIQYWTNGGWVNIFPKVTENASDHNAYVFEPLVSSQLRVNVSEGDSDGLARIVEIGVYLDPNLALGKEVAASGVQTGYSASYINDGNKATTGWKHWAADVTEPQWVEIDLGAMTAFRRVEVYSPSSYEQREYTIQYWDGSQWLAAFPTVTGNDMEHNSHSFDPVTASKLRVYVTEGNVQQHGQDGGENVARIAEIEIYNTSGQFVDNNVAPDPIPQSIDQRQDKTVVGAIRWDMWGGTDDPSDIGSQTEKTLSPEKYHFRLPWYATVSGPDEVHIPQYTQEIVDQEIQYAKQAGIDYWAFVMYESPTARDLYLSSAYKDDVKWAALLGASGYSFDNFPWLVSQFKTSNYQKVLDDRPLVYVWNTSKRYVDELRSEARKQGTAEPYIVIMGTNGKIMRQMQGDALSQYTNYGANGSPYSTLINNDRNNWNLLADYGAQVIPTVTAGWDPRPRIDTPVWTSYGEDQWAQTATAQEIADNLKNALDWNDSHRSSSLPNAVLMYAWNENDEGGWIIPTLGADGRPDTSRLDAIQAILRPEPPTDNDGGDDGSSDGNETNPGSQPSSGSQPNPDDASDIRSGVVKLEAEPPVQGIASASVQPSELLAAAEQSEDKSIVLVVRAASEARGVQVNVPASDWLQAVAQTGNGGTLKIQTDLGTVSVESGLLSNSQLSGASNLQLSIVKVDPSELPPEVRQRVGARAVYDLNLSLDGHKLTSFNGNEIKVELPYALSPGENPGQVVINYITDNGKLEVVMNGYYNVETGKVEFRPTHLSKYVPMHVQKVFRDLDGYAWAGEAVLGLAAREVVAGRGEDQFVPEGQVTRAEFVQMLVRLFDLSDSAAVAGFNDVNPGAWYYSAIASAQEAGLVAGKDDGSFGVNDRITREDMAVLMHRALKLQDSAYVNVSEARINTGSFQDIQSASGYATEAISALYQAGVINGMSAGLFDPKGSSTRAQAATALYRLYQFMH